VKIRTGFVSNSSSSSFLVSFPPSIETDPGAVIEYLFGPAAKLNHSVYVNDPDNLAGLNFDDLAAYLLEQMNGAYESAALSRNGILENILWEGVDRARPERLAEAEEEATRLLAKGARVFYFYFPSDEGSKEGSLLRFGFKRMVVPGVSYYQVGD
jgi:hypothetical protein